jgi:hypothetical protein
MPEPGGIALASISLAAQTFNGCVTALQLISKARHSNELLLDFSTKVDLEIARLIIWGRNSGLANDQLDPSLEPVRSLLFEILTRIKSSIENTDKLKSVYGIVLVQDAEPRQADGHDRSSSQIDQSLDILSIADLAPEVERQKGMAKKLKQNISLYRKMKWTTWDEEIATKFVESIKEYVNGLNKLLTESQRATLDAETTAMRIAILGTNWSQPLEMLRILETATNGRYESIALPARLARVKLELEMEALAPESRGSGAPPPPSMTIDYDQLKAIDNKFSYVTGDGSSILIEWQILTDSQAVGESARARTVQTAKLVGLFRGLRQQPTEYRVLNCVGYVDQKENSPPRLGIAFNIPTSTPPNSSSRPFVTLHDFFVSKEYEHYLPSLGERFQLARTLTRGFLQFHQLQWLHKDIRSHNIVFFTDNSNNTETRYSVSSPYILGFAYSRSVTMGISVAPPHDPRLAIYRHPAYLQSAQRKFRLRYDLFSIGLLLFEIAKWRPLMKYYTDMHNPDLKTFVSQLCAKEAADLEFRVGKTYKDAMFACLEGAFGVKDDGEPEADKRLKLAFFEKVVKVLDQCQA